MRVGVFADNVRTNCVQPTFHGRPAGMSTQSETLFSDSTTNCPCIEPAPACATTGSRKQPPCLRELHIGVESLCGVGSHVFFLEGWGGLGPRNGCKPAGSTAKTGQLARLRGQDEGQGPQRGRDRGFQAQLRPAGGRRHGHGEACVQGALRPLQLLRLVVTAPRVQLLRAIWGRLESGLPTRAACSLASVQCVAGARGGDRVGVGAPAPAQPAQHQRQRPGWLALLRAPQSNGATAAAVCIPFARVGRGSRA